MARSFFGGSLSVSSSASTCGIALSLLVTAAGCASASTTEEAEGALGVAHSEVEAADSPSQFAIVQDGSQASKATGALEIPLRGTDGQPAFITSTTTVLGFPHSTRLAVRGTCGVTFISPHYAVTAAHCVEQVNVPDPANETFVVRQYDVTNASLSGLETAALFTGSFPNYQPSFIPMQNVAGYQSTALSCTVVSRCASPSVANSAAFNCDFSADVAMLHCGDRASNAMWLPVATSDPLAGAVEMYWFHELLSPMPNTKPAPNAPATTLDRFTHYTALAGNAMPALPAQINDWHYIAGPTNALLPLKSIPWSNGAARQRLNHTTATDLFGCHGTSGSGVLQRNPAGNLELLGPVHSGGDWSNTRLCADPDLFQQGKTGLVYEPNSSTLQLQAKFSRALMLDRIGIVAVPPVGVSAQ